MTVKEIEDTVNIQKFNDDLVTDFEINFLFASARKNSSTPAGTALDIFGYNTCNFTHLSISSLLPKSVFAVKNLKVNLNTFKSFDGYQTEGIGEDPVLFLFGGNLTFEYFSEVNINNIYFSFDPKMTSQVYRIRFVSVISSLVF